MKTLKGNVLMDELNLPLDFIKNIQNSFEEEGGEFLANLPRLINEASQRWGLFEVQPVPNLSYNFVAFAKQSNVTLSEAKGLDGNDKKTLRSLRSLRETYDHNVILKIGVPNPELTSEMEALKLFNGDGACRLVDCDEGRGFLLLERLKPGKMLSELENDDERTHIAVNVMSHLWRDAPVDNNFIKLSDWFAALKKIRLHFDGTGPFPKKLLEGVESFLAEAMYAMPLQLLHGDFHHFNILLSDRGWLAIDPKGVVGPVGYEIGPLMINPWGSLSDGVRPALSSIEGFKAQTKRRMSILAERLGWDQESILNWATAHAVLSAWWDMQDDGTGGEYPLWCAEMFSEIK
ncbi:MAG: phosphotransferase [Chloroflexi bacterium]|nr:phosphotransferase [Chloroflexota bacterium]